MSRKDLEAANVIPRGRQTTHVPKEKQSMEGMPGYIKTGQGLDGRDSMRGHSGIGPHREGPIGEKGHGSTQKKIYGGKHTGSMVKDYKSESTGKGGHYKMSAEGQPASEPHKAEFKIGGHPGRMERMAGKARTHAEGRKKSHMY